MATKSIGTATRDYSTMQAWEDALLAILLEAERGEMYNDSEFTANLNISAHVTTSTNTLTLTAASGQSFQDNANVRTNALKYNASNGVGVRGNFGYSQVISISGAVNDLFVSRLQLEQEASAGNSEAFYAIETVVVELKDMIIMKDATGGRVVNLQESSKAINVVAIHKGSGYDGAIRLRDTCTGIGCLCLNPSDISVTGNGFATSYSTASIKSCGVFGMSTFSSGGTPTGSNNASDVTIGFGTSNQASLTYSQTTPFTDADKDSLDLRLADNGNSLINNGFLDSTNAPNDISGTARGASPEIGPWELGSAPSPVFGNTKQFLNLLGVGT